MRKLGSKNASTEERRRKISDAALSVFLEEGLLGATIDQVLVAADVSKGSLYHHFESKEGLAAALYVDLLRELHECLLEVLEGESSAERGVKTFVRTYVEWFLAHPKEGRYVFLAQGSEVLSAYARLFSGVQREFLERSFAWVLAQKASGKIRDLPRSLYVPVIIGPSRDYVRTALRDGGSISKEAARHLAELAWESTRALPATTDERKIRGREARSSH